MPIRPELRHHYETDLWKTISEFVRFKRAEGRCDRCGRRHGQGVYAHQDGRVYERPEKGWVYPSGKPAPHPTLVEWLQVRIMSVKLATAHLDHDPTHNSDWNLSSFCQWCHLEHDRFYHLLVRRSKFAIRDLFDEAA